MGLYIILPAFLLIGIGTFIDSLYAIKKTVFEDRKYTLEHLKEMIKADFQGFEADRQYLMNSFQNMDSRMPE